ncbi:MAG TPA: hypothetical protein VMF10_15155 [Candidatus Aquilonibacter sp.]|nr:hypothetical protein [Candidatus Aquilonibacter sp.]
MASQDPQQSSNSTSEWSPALPEQIPESTYAPFFLALGTTFLLFGIVSSYIFSGAGLILIAWAIGMWVSEFLAPPVHQPNSLRDDQQNE